MKTLAIASLLPDTAMPAFAIEDGRLVIWMGGGGPISAVTPSAKVTEGILPAAWDAVSSDGKVRGDPIPVEAASLVYKTDLVTTPPADLADISGLTVPGRVTCIM